MLRTLALGFLVVAVSGCLTAETNSASTPIVLLPEAHYEEWQAEEVTQSGFTREFASSVPSSVKATLESDVPLEFGWVSVGKCPNGSGRGHGQTPAWQVDVEHELDAGPICVEVSYRTIAPSSLQLTIDFTRS